MRIRVLILALAAVTSVSLAACGPTAVKSAGQRRSAVSVAYAGSLAYMNDQVLGPAFTKATGIAYEGRGSGSWALAHELQSGIVQADVFESLGFGPIAAVGTEKANWAIGFATSPLVVAYNPKSRYAAKFEAIAKGLEPVRDLFTLLATPGLRLGRTNPATDPQGQTFYLMVELAQRIYHLPPDTTQRILGAWNNPSEVFSEEGLPTQLEAGGLDAASAFLPQAKQHGLSYIVLPAVLDFADPAELPLYASAAMTIPSVGTVHGQLSMLALTVLKGRNAASGVSFARFVLARAQAHLWRSQGYELIRPLAWGLTKDMPKGLPR